VKLQLSLEKKSRDGHFDQPANQGSGGGEADALSAARRRYEKTESKEGLPPFYISGCVAFYPLPD
jgi:hypothetical protein